MMITIFLFISFGTENYITLKLQVDKRVQNRRDRYQRSSAIFSSPSGGRCFTDGAGGDSAAPSPADARVPRESEAASELPWVRGPSGSSSTFLPTTLPTLSTTHRNSGGSGGSGSSGSSGGGPSQWRRLSACLSRTPRHTARLLRG